MPVQDSANSYSSAVYERMAIAAIVLVVLVTTIVTPPLVRWSFAKEKAQPQATPHLTLPTQGE